MAQTKTYRYFIGEARRLVQEIVRKQSPDHFEDNVEKLVELRQEVISRYEEMSLSERRDVTNLVGLVIGTIREKMDIFRIREMRKALEREGRKKPQ